MYIKLNPFDKDFFCIAFAEKTVILLIKAEDYLNMPPDLNVKVFFSAHVRETRQAFATMETVEFVKPELENDVRI